MRPPVPALTWILLSVWLVMVPSLAWAQAAEAAPRNAGRGGLTRIVAADGSAVYRRISDAMRDAPAGSVIVVKPGTYRETIWFRSGVTLRGEDAKRCIIHPAVDMPAALIAVDCPSGAIEKLTFEGPYSAPGRMLSLGMKLEVRAGGVWIKEVVPGGPAEAAGIRGGRVSRVNGRPVGQCSYLLTACAVQAGDGGTVRVEVEHDGRIERAELRPRVLPDKEQLPDGVAMIASSLQISECIFRGCDTGVFSQGEDSRPELRRNICQSNLHGGIAFWAGSRGLAEINVCERSGTHAICVTGRGTTPLLVSNVCRDNDADGIYVAGEARGEYRANICERNKGVGIHVREAGTDVRLLENKCRNNSGAPDGSQGAQSGTGIRIVEGARATAERNVCEANRTGIEVDGAGTSATLRHNQANANKLFGIVFANGAAGEAEGNSCWRNQNAGIVVMGKTTIQLSDNHCVANTVHGIAFHDGAGGDARGNVCDNNGNCGIGAYGQGTHPALSRNTCRNNAFGISSWDGATPVIAADNRLSGNKKDLHK
ncbi:MAG TPA: right-handed parallel beta-helix repeat-containing protein [Phycisphaerae bacterium]|jgi:hypothetical protein|nr:right-handed parallel beta-helix repeat-containing protein [Phycisphaerae bacterium]HOJ55111.1 right-handed parallel beta-helix repeat-containing protein [Phycisphaerae bacterium]HOL27923.1 right-handed parallel beta-helix repeat-containing protein [Phycisphaerae bacterium]HPP21734.1 right-handed parallel beta-helix repeat-containing protein [Phycisphaerae bacterium]HPU31553.1 right-handed parallel beta-helix repeat-containing protein [Phycisphaerae bacterium]